MYSVCCASMPAQLEADKTADLKLPTGGGGGGGLRKGGGAG